VKSVAAYVIGFIAGVMILRALGVDPIPALTTASVAALAVGFGAQMLVRDVITGFFILLENQYAIGEYVTIAGITGTVEEIGMRITKIRDDVGKLTILANGTVSQVTNHSRGSLVSAMEISIPSGADIERATTLLNKIGETTSMDRNGDIVAPFRCDGIVAMDAGKVTLRISGRVSTGKQDEVLMDLRSRIRQKLIEDGIGII
jgi:small conductance mechanosensitive channel